MTQKSVKIAIIGRPNVGKSSLFNALLKERRAIIMHQAGTTRNINKKTLYFEDKEVSLLDTGGIDLSFEKMEKNSRTEAKIELFARIREAALKASREASLVLFVVDGRAFLDSDLDRRLFLEVSREAKNIFLVVNKIDNDSIKNDAFEFASFGAKEMFFISAAHMRGIKFLSERIKRVLALGEFDFVQKDELDSKSIRVAIIGRVNVGKSSLLNALCGKELSVVSDVVGTTTDPSDEMIVHNDESIVFTDTAGIRQRGRLEDIERFSHMRSNSALLNSHIGLLILDASRELVDLDEKIAGIALEHSLGVIIVLNKWDIAKRSYAHFDREIRHRFKFLSFAPIITVSSKNAYHMKALKDKIISVYKNMTFRIPTSELNRTFQEAFARNPIPSDHGKIIKAYYATQYDVLPPSFLIVLNHKSLHFSYKRYLVNFLRARYDFEGVPILIKTKDKKSTTQSESE